MFSTIAFNVIAVAICILIITYYRERKDLIRRLIDIDYQLSEMRTSLNKLEYINNKMIAIENKVQNSIDKTNSIKTNIENNVIARLTSIKADQNIYINKLDSKTNKLQNTIDALVKENTKISEALFNSIKKTTVDSETRVGIKLNSINERLDSIGSHIVVALDKNKERCEAKNSSKSSKTKNTTKSNKQESDELKTAE